MEGQDLKDRLLAASLKHVPFDGWSRAAILAGAEDLGIEGALALNAFADGADLIEAYSRWADRRMLADLEALDLEAMKVRERIAAGVRLRLEALAADREAVRRGLAFLALPRHGPLGLKCLYRTVDAIWYAAGDRSTDYNFYTKRLLLSGVYSSTLLFWLNDNSEGSAESWAFLDRRIGEVLRVAGGMGRIVKGALDFPDRCARRLVPSPGRR